MNITPKTQAALIGLATLIVTTFGTLINSKLNSIHTLANSNLVAVNRRLDESLTDNKTLAAKIESMHTLIQQINRPQLIVTNTEPKP